MDSFLLYQRTIKTKIEEVLIKKNKSENATALDPRKLNIDK
jgi:hypothetical protein